MLSLKIVKAPFLVIDMLLFLYRNLNMTYRVAKITRSDYRSFCFSACSFRAVSSVMNLFQKFHEGKKLGLSKNLILRLAGEKLCLVVTDEQTREVVGYSLYYFNARDRKEGTVHEGDTYLLPEYRGKGIGTAQRRHALNHFARCPFLKGVSSRVSLNNHASLKSNENLGFKPIERYFDRSMNEERVYMVCNLAPYRTQISDEQRNKQDVEVRDYP